MGDGNFRGIIRLNTTQGEWCLATVLLAHELGHALGFHHVNDPEDVMCTDTLVNGGDCNGNIWGIDRFSTALTRRLTRPAQLAYQLGRSQYPGVPDGWLTAR